MDRSLSTAAAVCEATVAAMSRGQVAVPAGDGPVRLAVDGETVSAAAAVVATDPPTARSLTEGKRSPPAGGDA